LLWGNFFYQKFEIFASFSFSYISPYFYTDNVKILLKRTEDLKQKEDIKYRQNRSRGLPVLHCSVEVMHSYSFISIKKFHEIPTESPLAER